MLLELPHELTLLVLRSLPPRSLQPLGRLCCACRALRRTASTSALWRSVCHGIFAAAELAAAAEPNPNPIRNANLNLNPNLHLNPNPNPTLTPWS